VRSPGVNRPAGESYNSRMARLAILLMVLSSLAGAWSPDRAAQYLESRQKLWIAWPRALRSGVPCISCHTGLPYLLSRAALRRAGDPPSPYESALIGGVRSKATDPKVTGSPAVLAALVLAIDDARDGASLSHTAEQAFDRMWSGQHRTGPNQGAWPWTEADLDPWETTDSLYYGAALAALATGTAPGDYQSRPGIRENVALLIAYLRGNLGSQPLHNRMALLWASTRLRDCLPASDRRAILDELRRKQSADGGWTVESLGAFKVHPNAPPAAGSNSYATAWAAFTLVKSGVPASDRVLARALEWLRTHQDPQAGYWDAQSMNTRYEPGSMPLEFMREAATGYAVAALAEAR
jgi:hypothetical protein